MAESFFATLEREVLNRRRFRSQAEARMAIFQWLEGWYNPHRRHSALGYRSPINYERRQLPQSAGNPSPYPSTKPGQVHKPNTRETVRRQTVHQFLDAGLVVINPDDPLRPTNSPKSVYQIEPSALTLLRTFGTPTWSTRLAKYRASVQSLKDKYVRVHKMKRIPITLTDGHEIELSPGGQNVLVQQILKEFCPRFAPAGHVIYAGDTDKEFAYFDKQSLKKLGVEIEAHGKMPDVVVCHRRKKWLLLIEAVTSHGPVDAKRYGELKKLFRGAKLGLVFVTAFLNRKTMVRFLGDISWETEVWIADAPDHLIHFNGERFLGPHK